MASQPTSSGRADVEATEATPLLGNEEAAEEEEDHTEQIPNTESVYSYVIFMPPLSRKKHGHYWTKDVCLAITLFLINCILQGGLTYITGRDILMKHNDWMTSLIDDVGNASKLEELDKTGTVGHVENQTRAGGKHILDAAKRGLHLDDGKSLGCCHGAECAILAVPCCAPKARPPSFFLKERPVPATGGAAAHWAQNATGFMAKPVRASDGKHKDGGKARQKSSALCRKLDDGSLDCAPPSTAFLNKWDDLDFDGDGLWTVEEAREDAANLACTLGVPVIDVFQNAVRGLAQDMRETTLIMGQEPKIPFMIEHRRALTQEYFQWWEGIAAICVMTDAAICGQLMTRHLFDGAMDPKAEGHRGAVVNIDSAMTYCGRLLTPGGICDTALPGTYVLYRDRVTEKCGPASYMQGPRYANPFDVNDVMGTVKVSYETHSEYAATAKISFQLFLFLVLFIWYANIIDELKDVLRLWDYVWNFPVDRNMKALPPRVNQAIEKAAESTSLSKQAAEEKAEEYVEDVVTLVDGTVRIQRISTAHWQMCLLMAIMRIFLVFYMCYVGTFFLLSNHTLIDLLLNAVALAFIFELDEFLYSFLVSEETKREIEAVEPLTFPSSFPQTGPRKGLYQKGNWGLIVIPTICIFVIIYNDVSYTVPIIEALECACFQDGPKCRDRMLFSQEWWRNYWINTANLAN